MVEILAWIVFSITMLHLLLFVPIVRKSGLKGWVFDSAVSVCLFVPLVGRVLGWW